MLPTSTPINSPKRYGIIFISSILLVLPWKTFIKLFRSDSLPTTLRISPISNVKSPYGVISISSLLILVTTTLYFSNRLRSFNFLPIQDFSLISISSVVISVSESNDTDISLPKICSNFSNSSRLPTALTISPFSSTKSDVAIPTLLFLLTLDIVALMDLCGFIWLICLLKTYGFSTTKCFTNNFGIISFSFLIHSSSSFSTFLFKIVGRNWIRRTVPIMLKG